MPDRSLADFNQFLHQNIPAVRFMQLELLACNEHTLTAGAPAQPNLNDKKTIFGGSSAALLTVCGWSLIKYNLEQRNCNHDVVIARADTQWLKAQTDDLQITAQCETHWPDIIAALNNRQQPKITIQSQVNNPQNQPCTTMTATFVVLWQQ